jgi:uncharacterized membrane protein
MAFCQACGQEVGTASFCPKCGAAQGAASTPAAAAPAATGTEGLQENIAGLLCYFFGWVSGLIFLLIDKRPFVRFHGAQSIALNLALFGIWILFWIVSALLTVITAMLHFPIGFLSFFLFPLIGLGFLAVWIYCMYQLIRGRSSNCR